MLMRGDGQHSPESILLSNKLSPRISSELPGKDTQTCSACGQQGYRNNTQKNRHTLAVKHLLRDDRIT